MRFVLLSPRRGAEVLAAEYQDFCTMSGLAPNDLEQRALDEADSPLGEFEDVTGVFIGGSPFTLTDEFTDPEQLQWQRSITARLTDFIADVLMGKRYGKLPVFAVCYAAGMLAETFGGLVGQEYSEDAGPTRVSLTPAAFTDPVTAGLPPEFVAVTGHKDSVMRLPVGSELLADGPTCPAQLYRMGEHVWTSQFHPEMDGPAMARRLAFYLENGYFQPGEHQRTLEVLYAQPTPESNALLRNFVAHARSLTPAQRFPGTRRSIDPLPRPEAQ